MNLSKILPVILTWNEAPNIARTLDGLRWAQRVVVLDSGSSDDTQALAIGYPNVAWHVRAFDDHAAQCNHALDALADAAEWVLFLDADYVVQPAMAVELALLEPPSMVSGYRAGFRYCVAGRPLRGALYPPRIVLFRRAHGRYVQEGHAQVLQLNGAVRELTTPILHDDRKAWPRFIANQQRYATLEAAWLRAQRWSALGWPDRLRRLLVIAPWAAPLVALARGAVLDGGAGWRYAWERCVAEWLISRALLRQLLGVDVRQ
jgi:glycosyltransferase involved in cell wall biosynthesis